MRASRQAAGAFGYFARKLSEKCSEEHSTLGSVSGLTASAASVAPEKSDSAMAASSAWFEIRIGSSPLLAFSKPSTDDAKPLHVRTTCARAPQKRRCRNGRSDGAARSASIGPRVNHLF